MLVSALRCRPFRKMAGFTTGSMRSNSSKRTGQSGVNRASRLHCCVISVFGDLMLCASVGRHVLKNGSLRFTTKKCPTALELPLPPALTKILEASLTGALTFLLTDYGKSFTDKGFGGWFRERCDAAGLPHCSAHGLRKAAATALAEAGASAHQLMSWSDGQRSQKPSDTPGRPIKRSSPRAWCH